MILDLKISLTRIIANASVLILFIFEFEIKWSTFLRSYRCEESMYQITFKVAKTNMFIDSFFLHTTSAQHSQNLHKIHKSYTFFEAKAEYYLMLSNLMLFTS